MKNIQDVFNSCSEALRNSKPFRMGLASVLGLTGAFGVVHGAASKILERPDDGLYQIYAGASLIFAAWLVLKNKALTITNMNDTNQESRNDGVGSGSPPPSASPSL